MLSTIGTTCELTESVIFQPVDHIQTSKVSWIFTTAINFTPYLRTLNSVFNYDSGVTESLVDFAKTFYREDPRYMKLLNMTLDDMTLALDEITNMQFEASNLIGHIQNRNKDLSYLLEVYLDSYLAQQIKQILMLLKLISNNCTKFRWIKQMF